MKIFVPPIEIKDNEGFTPKNDIFKRKSFGESLLNLINNTDDKLVIALDAPWGEGKTTFIKQWQGLVKTSDHSIESIYFDAFENDYHKDAFLSLSRHIYQSIESTDKSSANKFKDSAMPILKKIATSGVKVAIKAGTLNILDDSILEGAGTGEEITNNIDKFLNNELTSLKADEEHLNNFKYTLQTLGESNSNKKIVFIIDELDRCNPKFALELLENIKHLFSVPKLVFLLVINRKQLEESIRCEYGQGIEATNYLQKFINIWVTLPKSEIHDQSITEVYITKCLDNMGDSGKFRSPTLAMDTMIQLAEHLNLSLREIERSLTNFAVICNAYYGRYIGHEYCLLIPYISIVKTKYPNAFHKILNNKINYKELFTDTAIESLYENGFSSSGESHQLKWIIRFYLSSRTEQNNLLRQENFPPYADLDYHPHLLKNIAETLNNFNFE